MLPFLSASTAEPCYRYLIGGITVRSQVELPALTFQGTVCQVEIRKGNLTQPAGGWVDVRRRFRAAPDRWLFDAEDGCRFLLRQGAEVIYQQAQSVSGEALAEHLLQPVLGALLHQRGLLALHASAVQTPRGIVAMMGPMGTGKSTLAAWFHGQGVPAVADDVCPIDTTGQPTMTGGFGYLKVSPDMLRQLAIDDLVTLPVAGDTRGRIRVRCHEHAASAQPMAAIYLLRPIEGRHLRPAIRRLNPPEAIETLIAHTYRRQYLRGLGLLPRHLLSCTVLSQRVPIQEIQFPRNVDVSLLGRAVLDDLRELHTGER